MSHIEIETAAIILVLIAAFVVRLIRKPKDRYGKRWEPLAAIIGGSAQGSRLKGSYQGLPIMARIGGEGDETPNYFYEVTVTLGPAPKDWALSFTGEKFLGSGTKAWRIKSKDDDLRTRLADAGAVAAVQDWPNHPEITFKGKTGTLHYWQRASGMYDLPSVEAFQAQLELLAKLSAMNRQANVD